MRRFTALGGTGTLPTLTRSEIVKWTIPALLALWSMAPVCADVQVEFSSNGQSYQDLTNDEDVTIDPETNDVTIDNAGFWRISVSLPSSEDLGEIYFSAEGGAMLTLLITTTGALPNPGAPLPDG
jgi:hypothetical protein